MEFSLDTLIMTTIRTSQRKYSIYERSSYWNIYLTLTAIPNFKKRSQKMYYVSSEGTT